MKTFFRILLPILTLLCLVFIFHNSLQDAGRSGERSKGIANAVSDRYEEVTKSTVRRPQRDRMYMIVRKIAHLAEYGALAVCMAFSVFAFRGRVGWLYGPLFGVGILVAALDEWLQSFSKGRSPAVSDALLDLGGVLLGFCVSLCVTAVIRRKRRKYELGVSVS